MSNAAEDTTLRAGLDGSQYVAGARTITKANLDIEASANKASMAVSSMEAKLAGMSAANRALTEMQSNTNSVSAYLTKLEERIVRIGATIAVFTAVGLAVRGVTGFVRGAISAIDDFQLTVIGMASSLTQIAIINNNVDKSGKSLGLMYAESARYAEVLAAKMREVDRNSIANYSQIMDMLQVYTSTGKVLDVNNKLQMEGWTALSNAIPIMTKGQDVTRQMTTEMRALSTGATTAGSTIAKAMDSMLKSDVTKNYKNGLKDLIAEANKTGVSMLELLAPYLAGYTASLPQVVKTFTAAKTTLETAFAALQRNAFSGVYSDIVGLLTSMSGALEDNAVKIKQLVGGAWDYVKGKLFDVDSVTKQLVLKQEVLDGFKSFANTMLLAGEILGRLSMLIFTHLEAITKAIKLYIEYKMVMAMVAVAHQIENAYIVARTMLSGEYVSAKQAEILKEQERTAALNAQLISKANMLAMDAEKLAMDRTIAAQETIKAEAIASSLASQVQLNYAKMEENSQSIVSIRTRGIELEQSVALSRANLAQAESRALSATAYYESQYAMSSSSLFTAEAAAIEAAAYKEVQIAQTQLMATEAEFLAMKTAMDSKYAHGLGLHSEEITLLNAESAAQLRLVAAQRAEIALSPAVMAAVESHNLAMMKAGLTTEVLTTAKVAKMTVEERETVLSGAHTAALLEQSAATETLTVANKGLSMSFSTMLGALGIIALVLYEGYQLWEKWGNAAEKAKKQAGIKAEDAVKYAENVKKEMEAAQARDEAIFKLAEGKNAATKEDKALALSGKSDAQKILDLQAQLKILDAYDDEMDYKWLYEDRDNKKLEEKRKILEAIDILQRKALVDSVSAPIQAPKSAPPVMGLDKDGYSSYNESVSAFNKLRDAWEQWDTKAIKAGKVHDELTSKIENETHAMETLFAETIRGNDIDRAGMDIMRAHIKLKYESIVADLILADTKKGQASLEKANEAQSMQAYKSNLAERSSALKLQLEDNKIDHYTYYTETAKLIQEESAKEIAIAQGVVDEKRKIYNELMDSGPQQSSTSVLANAEIIKAETLLDKVRSDASKKFQDNSRANVKSIEQEKKALIDLKNTTIDKELAVSASKAALVGTNGETGEITDPSANARSVANAAFEQQMANYQREKDAILEIANTKILSLDQQIAYEKQYWAIRESEDLADLKRKQAIAAAETKEKAQLYNNLSGMAQRTFPKITAFQTAAHLMTKKYDQEETGFIKNGEIQYRTSTKGKMQMTADYTGFAGEALSNLADSQDQSTRAGFESAKAFNLGAAVMSTASAIITQLSGPDGWAPSAWARAAIAGVLGAVQIAKIASTSYGGGGSASSNVPSGSFGGGSAGQGGTVGGSIGTPLTSVRDSKSAEQLTAIADNMENASLALMKVADGLTKVADMFKEGSSLSLAGGALASNSLTSNTMGIMKVVGQSLKDGLTLGFNFNDIKSFFVSTLLPGLGGLASSIFGGSKSISAQGISLGLTGGQVSAQNYQTVKTSGGWFSSDKYNTQYATNDPAQRAFQAALNRILGTVNTAVASMGTSVNLAGANLAGVNISTAGKKPEDINKEIQVWFESAANTIAKNVVGLQDFAYYGENAFDAIVRLSTALQGVNEKLSLVGAELMASTLKGADAAFRLQELMGGADTFATKVDDYFTAMFTDAQQQAAKTKQALREVNTTFAYLGWNVPKTKDQFNLLVKSLDMNSDAGMAAFAALMDVAPAFGLVQDNIQKLADATRSFNNDLTLREMKLAGIDTTLYELRLQHEDELKQATLDGMDTTRLQIVQQKEWADSVAKATGVVTKSASQIAEALRATISNIVDAQTAILNTWKSISTGPAAMLTPEQTYNNAKATFAGLQAKLAADPADITALQALPDAANKLLDASKGYNASGAAYQSDLQTVLSYLALQGGATASNKEAVDLQLAELILIKNALTTGALVTALGESGTLAKLLVDLNANTDAALQTKREQAVAGLVAMVQPLIAQSNTLKEQERTPAQLQAIADARAVYTAEVKEYQDIYDTAKSSRDYWAGLGATEYANNNQATMDYYLPFLNERKKKLSDFEAVVGPIEAGAAQAAELLPGIITKIAAYFTDINKILDTYKDPSALAITKTPDTYTRADTWKLDPTTKERIFTWTNERTGTVKDLLEGVQPSFAKGSAYLPYDMIANVHQGEIIMDRRSADVLRKYGIPTNGSADNSAVVSELQESNKQLVATVRVLQAGFNKLIAINEKQAESQSTIADKSKLQAAA